VVVLELRRNPLELGASSECEVGEETQFGTVLLQLTTTIELKPEDALQHATGNGRTTSLPSNSRAGH
jgi:hypothetical protein